MTSPHDLRAWLRIAAAALATSDPLSSLEAAKKVLLERARALEKLTGDENNVVPTAPTSQKWPR